MTDDRLAAHHLETVLGQTIDLIPYEREHVPMFNRWLQDPEMQQLVATPAVTVDADYSFQEECAHSTDKMIKLIRLKEHGQVIGDVDMFFSPEGGAEVNIMIASPEWRRHGYASEALTLAMQYAVQRFGVKAFVAKISAKNEASLKFFERHGYHTDQAEPNVFGEFVYHMDAGDLPSADLNIHSRFNIAV